MEQLNWKNDPQLVGFYNLVQFILTNKRSYLGNANGMLGTEFEYKDLPFLLFKGLDLLKDHPKKEIIQKIASKALEFPFHLLPCLVVDI